MQRLEQSSLTANCQAQHNIIIIITIIIIDTNNNK
jgi:hypothetical protein